MIGTSASLAILALLALPAAGSEARQTGAPQDPARPHAHGQDSLEHRGDEGMGFSQSKTTHHFLLKPDGGVIAVSAKDADDAESQEQIRRHLAHIARAFAEGDFDIPMFVHDQTPPGVAVMTEKRDRIHYRFEATDEGGRVVITTDDPEARAAVHDFLRFQIREHATGDPTVVP